jgi:hypothetical protein
MDQNSLNYDIMAEEDDGSCIYCDSIITPVANKTLFLIDNYGGSIHYGQQILKIDLDQHADTFSYIQCGDAQCVTSAKLTSLIDQTMSVTFNVNIGSPVFLNRTLTISIGGHDTQDVKEFDVSPLSDCIPITAAPISASLQSQPFYH